MEAMSPEFLAFWQAYPRPMGKPAAWKAWKKAMKDGACVEAITDGLRIWKRSKLWHQAAKQDSAFIPHPSTWLNQVRWEDDPGTLLAVEILTPAEKRSEEKRTQESKMLTQRAAEARQAAARHKREAEQRERLRREEAWESLPVRERHAIRQEVKVRAPTLTPAVFVHQMCLDEMERRKEVS